MVAVICLVSAVAWLAVLVATSFNAVAVGAGLMAALYITGKER